MQPRNSFSNSSKSPPCAVYIWKVQNRKEESHHFEARFLFLFVWRKWLLTAAISIDNLKTNPILLWCTHRKLSQIGIFMHVFDLFSSSMCRKHVIVFFCQRVASEICVVAYPCWLRMLAPNSNNQKTLLSSLFTR